MDLRKEQLDFAVQNYVNGKKFEKFMYGLFVKKLQS